MKSIIIISFFFGINLISCQDLTGEKMLEKFVVDLFDDSIPAENIIETYLQIEAEINNELSILERKKAVEQIIEKTRNGEGVKGSWIIPNNEIKHLKNPKIYPYEKYENINNLEISGIDTIKENVFVILDTENKKILNYFLLNSKNDKIISFSLLVKAENNGWFFAY